MSQPTPRSAARRADAKRNREKILATARTAFAEPDADISMAEVSRRAGVGMATLYRNFANRRELLEALYVDEVDALCQAAAAVEGKTAGARLEAWLHRFFTYFTSKRHIASELLQHADRDDPLFDRNRARVVAAGEPLLLAAQQSREIRADVTLDQILDMIAAIANIHRDPTYVEPILQTAFDGLRTAALREHASGRW